MPQWPRTSQCSGWLSSPSGLCRASDTCVILTTRVQDSSEEFLYPIWAKKEYLKTHWKRLYRGYVAFLGTMWIRGLEQGRLGGLVVKHRTWAQVMISQFLSSSPTLVSLSLALGEPCFSLSLSLSLSLAPPVSDSLASSVSQT